jgi:ribose-phosphate pyrophosphokinase
MILLNNKQIEIKKFPNGESFLNIEDLVLQEINEIKLKFESDEDITHLIFLKGHLDDVGTKAKLIIGYLPYSRMDRTEGMRVFTLKYFTRLINSMNFESVVIYEPHSDVGTALLDRVCVVNMSAEIGIEVLEEVQKNGSAAYIVYPDAGAAKRYSKQIKYDKILTANKERDFHTGNIKSLEINGTIEDSDFDAIIIDDLCSKGGTFIMTAEKLKEMGARDIYLVVTHCEDTIFQGDVLKSNLIKKIYTTNSILTKEDNKIKVNKII